MSLPARSALIAAGNCRNVYFTPGGPLTARSFDAIALPLLDFAAIAPRMHIIAESNSFTSNDCRCALPGNAAYIESNVFVNGAPSGTAGRVPRAPSIESFGTVDGIVAGCPPPTNSFVASNLPVRNNAAPTFAYVAGKSRITNASGLPATI